MYLCECMYMFVCVHVCAICEYAGVNVLIVVFVCLREKNDEEKKKPHKRQQCKYEDEKEKKKKKRCHWCVILHAHEDTQLFLT